MAIYKRCDRCQKDITDTELVKIDAVIKKPAQWTRGFFPFKTVSKMYCMNCFLRFAKSIILVAYVLDCVGQC